MNIGKLQQPIGTLQIPSRFCKEFFKFAKLMRKIPNELGSQKTNASRSLPVILIPVDFACQGESAAALKFARFVLQVGGSVFVQPDTVLKCGALQIKPPAFPSTKYNFTCSSCTLHSSVGSQLIRTRYATR